MIQILSKRSALAAAYVLALALLLSGAVAAAALSEPWSPVALGAGTLLLGLAGMIALLGGIEKGDRRTTAAGAIATAAAVALVLA